MAPRGRRTHPPPSLTYQQWMAAGRPPLSMSATQFGPWLEPKITKQRIGQFIVRGDIERIAGVIATDNPRNAAWLRSREGMAPPTCPPGRTHAVRRAGGSVGETGNRATPATRRVPAESGGLESAWLNIDTEVFESILEAMGQGDFSRLTGADVDKLRKMESALKTRVEREQKRGLLVERSMVQTVFGRMYQIDTNEWKTLGAKLAPDIAGALGVEDPAVLLSIEQKVDAETTKILQHVKRLLDDFLAKVGGHPV